MIYEEDGKKRWKSDVISLMEMAMNLRQSDSGLPMVIWVSTREAYGVNISHGPRIKVMSTHDQKAKRDLMYSVDITPPFRVRKSQLMKIDPSDLKTVKQWIKNNRESLIRYWNDDIGAQEFLEESHG